MQSQTIILLLMGRNVLLETLSTLCEQCGLPWPILIIHIPIYGRCFNATCCFFEVGEGILFQNENSADVHSDRKL